MKRKIIRDAIYTYIEIDRKARVIIDSESFQRLKNIKQLTIQHLYPSANHTRFEHSLGVMHLALRVFEKIKVSLQENLHKNSGGNLQSNLAQYLDYLRDHLFYASLLHDVGHAPFSHVGEKLYNMEDMLTEIERELKEKGVTFDIGFLKNDENIAPHEIMSCYVIARKFTPELKKHFLAEKKKHKTNLDLDLEFIFRIICGKKYSDASGLVDLAARNIVISIVHSDTVDVDKIDYLLRDNKMVGYIGPQLDVNRLIMSMTVGRSGKLIFTPMGIPALQGLIECRDALYLWVFNHHTVVYTDYLYQEFFIHFNNLYEKMQKENEKYEEALPLHALFSCKAIADDCVSDVDALSAINKACRIVRNEATSSEYTKKLVNQLIKRQFLKPLWKTLNEYNGFLAKCGFKINEADISVDQTNESEQLQKTDKYASPESELSKKLSEYIHDNTLENRKQLVHEIAEKLGIEHGNLFIVERENKFCEKILDKLEVEFDRKTEKLLKILLPIKDYENKYEKTAFYVYCERGKMYTLVKEELRNKLIKLKGKFSNEIEKEHPSNRNQNFFDFAS